MDRAQPFLPPAGWMQSAMLARVVSIDDPEARDRVQLRLFAFDGVDDQDAPLWARVVAELAHQVTRITVGGWNPVNGSAVSGEATTCAHAGPGTGTSGAEWLARALAPRSEHLGHLALATDEEARAVAAAAFDQRARRFVRLDGVAEGNARLRVGTHVEVSGLSPRFDNTYYVVEARHRYDLQTGYRTEFVGECAWLGAH